MSWGFVIVRHVCSKSTDLYWKESYRCIRKVYGSEIHVMIIDDSSKREFLNEDIVLTNCTVIYDTQHTGSAELLPYYYFHLLKPFDVAIVMHDSVFMQQKVDFGLDESEPCRFLWSFPHFYDDEIKDSIAAVCAPLTHNDELMSLFWRKDLWMGCFGVMSVIRWTFLDRVNHEENLFKNWLECISCRSHRHALERAMALVLTRHHTGMRPAVFGDIYHYTRWGVTFSDYLTQDFPVPAVKVWTAR